jgi:hypothetical protein
MAVDAQVTSIAHVIQQAVAPVFLIAGISGMLGVLTQRVARVVERSRKLEEQLGDADTVLDARLRKELSVLARRARLVNWAVGCCTVCALLICLVVVALFVGALLELNLPNVVATLFIAAMTAFIAGLLFFLREIRLAIAHLRIGPPI